MKLHRITSTRKRKRKSTIPQIKACSVSPCQTGRKFQFIREIAVLGYFLRISNTSATLNLIKDTCSCFIFFSSCSTREELDVKSGASKNAERHGQKSWYYFHPRREAKSGGHVPKGRCWVIRRGSSAHATQLQAFSTCSQISAHTFSSGFCPHLQFPPGLYRLVHY